MKENIEMSKTYQITGKKSGPRVLISAGVHGDEYEPMLSVLELIKLLPATLQSGTVTLVPVVNTSAFRQGTRRGKDGLDLARICPGNPQGTESEIAAAAISQLIRQADYYIDLHTGGCLYDIFPLAGYMLHASPAVLEKQQAMAKAFNLPVIWGTDSTPDGRTLSVARDANVPAIYAEYGGSGVPQKKIVQAYTTGCIGVLKQLQMMGDAGTEEQATPYWVEDYTPDGGYLQGKMPAPVEGIFEPSVALGAEVKKGELWGTITHPTDNIQQQVYADTNGIVLFLRTAPFVKTGDALGGILPITKPGKLVINGK
ncbi:succinylglutamate desuccinylase/aspartoacylase family protein [Chitinophaga sp. MM2321]|uniref:succinylglutamate desuccinylase/aspartoacylase family protein n=1 Tax=Chitinophaga sp. MM2321 TaxID=3137178 RepID=UPI0032D598D1